MIATSPVPKKPAMDQSIAIALGRSWMKVMSMTMRRAWSASASVFRLEGYEGTNGSESKAFGKAQEAYASQQLLEGLRVPSPNASDYQSNGNNQENRATPHPNGQRNP